MNHFIAHDNAYANKVKEIGIRCLDIANELCSIQQFVTTDKVLHVLLQRYGILNFEQLNVGPFYSLPPITLLWELNKKVLLPLKSF